VSFHLGETASTIDLAVGFTGSSQYERIERIANELIAEDRNVTVRTVSSEEQNHCLPLDGYAAADREGTIRLIEIADYTSMRAVARMSGLSDRLATVGVRSNAFVKHAC